MLVLTDGIKYLADKFGAYRLVNIVASYQTKKFQREHPFQLWTLEVDPETMTGVVYCRDDSGQGHPRIVEQ